MSKATVWQTGQTILGLYEVKGVLGEGGMGRVYRVHHTGWGLDLAAKVPRPQLLSRKGAAEDFEREAETWVSLGLHPHTVSCYYVRRLDGLPVVFAELVEGGSLRDWIDTGKLYQGGPKEALGRILDVAIQFAWGLHHAHEQGLVHQDVKPANVMMSFDGTAKVTDFGLARARAAAGERAAHEAAVGGRSILVSMGGMTPAYCSPEQAERHKLTPRTDVWSWAVSVLEMFTSDVSWGSGTAAAEALEAYLEAGAPDERLPAMPAELVELLRQCLRRRPQERPQDMTEVAARLQRVYRRETAETYRRTMPPQAELLADSLNNRAASLLDLATGERAGQLEQRAEQFLEEALRADGQHLESTYNRLLLRWRSGRLTDLEMLRQLQQACPDAADGTAMAYLRAQVHLERGDCASAIAALQGVSGAASGEVVELLARARAQLPSSGRCLQTLEGHSEGVTSVSLSGDGRLALSGSYDKTLRLWELSSGRCLQTLAGHTAAVRSVSLSGDGRLALSGGADGTVRLWELSSGRCLRTLQGHSDEVNAVCLSGDGRLALSGSGVGGSDKVSHGDNSVRLWDLSSGDCLGILEGHTRLVSTVCLSGDSCRALSGSLDGWVRLWELPGGRCLHPLEGHWVVRSVCFSDDGRQALSGGKDGTLRLWDLSSGRCLRILRGHVQGVLAVALTGDGRHALSGSCDRTLRLWELSSGRCLRTFKGHDAWVTSVSLSGDGRLALSGSDDRTVRLWSVGREACARAPAVLSRLQTAGDLLRGQSAHEQALEKASQALARGDARGAAGHVDDARRLPGYERSPQALGVWSQLYLRWPRRALRAAWQSGTLEGHTAAVSAVCLSDDGRHALSGSHDRTLRLWDLSSGRCLQTLEGHSEGVTSVSLSGDGRCALSGSSDKTLRLWELSSGRCLQTLTGHTAAVRSVSLSGDGRFALSGSADKTVRLWDLCDGRCLRRLEGHDQPVVSLCLSGDGRRALSGSRDSTLGLWELSSGRRLRTLFTSVANGRSGPLTSAGNVDALCLSGDGRYALSGIDDRTVRLWDLGRGRCLQILKGHTGGVTSVSLTIDGRLGLSGSSDKTLRLWELPGGRCLQTLQGHSAGVTAVSLSGDGRLALSGSSDKTLRLTLLDWELEEREPADWDEGARPYLVAFLSCQTPYAAEMPLGRQLSEEVLARALTRQGRPRWSAEDFRRLLHTLSCAGYGWLRPEGVKAELEKMAAAWKEPPSLA